MNGFFVKKIYIFSLCICILFASYDIEVFCDEINFKAKGALVKVIWWNFDGVKVERLITDKDGYEKIKNWTDKHKKKIPESNSVGSVIPECVIVFNPEVKDGNNKKTLEFYTDLNKSDRLMEKSDFWELHYILNMHSHSASK